MEKHELVKKAYAKINLGLKTLKKREDGYHELEMVMVNIDLYDTLYFALSAYSHEVIFTRMAGNINTDVAYQSVSASEYNSATEIPIET